jgi:SnoaL-like domain
MPDMHDDLVAIENLVVDSQYLIDSGRWSELVDVVFAAEIDGVVPEADFGFAIWRGHEEIRAGFDAAMVRFDAAMHAVTNLRIELHGDTATARYYVQGWHWVKDAQLVEDATCPTARPADFVVLGIMHDAVVRQAAGWRVASRRLQRQGPDVAVGKLPEFLAGLGDR